MQLLCQWKNSTNNLPIILPIRRHNDFNFPDEKKVEFKEVTYFSKLVQCKAHGQARVSTEEREQLMN